MSRKTHKTTTVYEDVTNAANQEDPYDALLLKKLRSMYNSCMDEDLLDARGQEPLLHVIRTVRRLFSGETTSIESASNMVQTKQDGEDKEKQRKGLTAALAYLHSRGSSAFEPRYAFGLTFDRCGRSFRHHD